MRSNRFVILLLIMAIGFTLLSSQVFLTSPQSNHHVDETCPSKSYSSSYTPHDAIWIQSNQEFRDQAALESWDGNGTADDPFIITGYSFNQETQPLRIWDTDVHWKFIDNIVDGVGDDIQCGTWIEDASNGAIIDCEFLNRHSGMVLMNAVNITITRNYIHDVRLNGLEIYGMMFDCEISDNVLDDCTSNGILLLNGMSGGNVSDNTITNCGVRGIRIQSGFFNSECCRNTVVDVGSDGISLGMVSSSLVSFNSISNASDFGMNIIGCSDTDVLNNSIQYITGIGMYLDYCQFSNVQMNEIFICSSIGLEVEHGENTTIYENTIGDCEDYALKLSANTEYFKTKFNVFLDSGVGCQLYDDGLSNYFGYNYYSDWQSPDVNSDSYVDIPYELDGSSGNADERPITVIGYYPTYVQVTTTTTSDTTATATTTTSDTNTTTTSSSTPDFPMQIVMIGGAVGAIVLVAGILMLKRR